MPTSSGPTFVSTAVDTSTTLRKRFGNKPSGRRIASASSGVAASAAVGVGYAAKNAE